MKKSRIGKALEINEVKAANANLNENIIKTSYGTNVFNLAAITRDATIDASGNVVSGTNIVTDYMSCNEGDIVYLTGISSGSTFNTTASMSMMYIVYYDANKAFISRSTQYVRNQVVPINAKYFRCVLSATIAAYAIPSITLNFEPTTGSQVGAYGVPYSSYDKIARTDVENVKSEIKEIKEPLNWINYDEVVRGYRVNPSNGSLVFASAHSVTDYIPVSNGEKLGIYGTTFQPIAASHICGYDKDRKFASGAVSDAVISKNKLDMATITLLSNIDASGNVVSGTSIVSDYITCNSGDVVHLTGITGANAFVAEAGMSIVFIAYYDASKTFISRSTQYVRADTAPTNAKYFRVALSATLATYYIVSITLNYLPLSSADVEPYGTYSFTVGNENVKYLRLSFKSQYLTGTQQICKNGFIPTSFNSYFKPYGAVRDDLVTSDFEVILPSVVPLAVGNEMNIYYNNCIKGGTFDSIREFFVQRAQSTGNGFIPLKGRTAITPTAAYNTVVNCVYNDGNGVKKKPINFVAVAPKSSGTISILTIGDSKVDAHVISQTLSELFTAAGVTPTLLGTRGTTYKDEGRSSWSTYEYCNLATYNSVTNAFWNATTSKFDFSYYMTQQSYTAVDIVSINLGTNDIWHVMDGVYDIASVIARYEEMVTSVRAFSATTRILIGLPEGACQLYLNDYKDNNSQKNYMLTLCKELIKKFDNRQSEKIFVTPLYLNMDLYEDYNMEDVALSARDTVKTMKMPTDRIHQATVGYQKNADTMYATIQYALTFA